MSRDDEVRRVAAELDSLLDDLGTTVAALNAILTTPPGPGDETNERLVAP